MKVNEDLNKVINMLNLPSHEMFRLGTLKKTKLKVYDLIKENEQLKKNNNKLKSDIQKYGDNIHKLKELQSKRVNTRVKSPLTKKGFKSILTKCPKSGEVVKYPSMSDCTKATGFKPQTIGKMLVDGHGKGLEWFVIPTIKRCVLCFETAEESKYFYIKDKALGYYYNHCMDCDDRMRSNRKLKTRERRVNAVQG